jgi:hypothetical protein
MQFKAVSQVHNNILLTMRANHRNYHNKQTPNNREAAPHPSQTPKSNMKIASIINKANLNRLPYHTIASQSIGKDKALSPQNTRENFNFKALS